MGLDNDAILQLIGILQSALTKDDKEPSAPKKRGKKKTVSTPRKKKSSNKFDNMPESQMCKEDLEFDRKVKKPSPSVRMRDYESELINVRCRSCGDTEKVHSSLVQSKDRYKCNKCSTGAG
jgi:ribosomal protein S27E